MTKIDPREVMTRALAHLRRQREPIAILGMSCRVPGASHPDALWQALLDGVDAIGPLPAGRFGAEPAEPVHGGFLDRVDLFDAAFFGISPREAAAMDPQQRLLLELCWEALESAGQAPQALAGSPTGVFVGIGIDDYKQHQLYAADHARVDAYSGTGTLFCVAAGRLSYTLGLQGPNLALDTGCSSSLVAVHLACQSLRAGECTMAIAAGVHLMLAPHMHLFLDRANALSPDRRCKTFDASADGYVRSEGGGVLVLKPLSAALADGDPIRAVIRGSAVNHDGQSSGLTVPNGRSQQQLLATALERASLRPSQVDFVEAHGTGTALGDPIEVAALAAVFGTGREAPLRVGSVKSNLGHLEAAAGMAGLIKLVLALENDIIPKNLHFHEPSPKIDWDAGAIEVVAHNTPWPRRATPRIGGVSSFGISGTNAHVLVEEAPAAEVAERHDTGDVLLPLSARHPAALAALARAMCERLSDANAPLADIGYTAALRRSHHPHRLAVVASSPRIMRDRLSGWLAGEPGPGVSSGEAGVGARRKIAFVFPGQGGQWAGMGVQLQRTSAVFAEALERAFAAIAPHVDFVPREALADAAALQRIDVVQPLLFSVQTALAAMWRGLGLEPDAVVGHSLGEVAASCVAGALDLEDAARVICRRSRLMRRIAGRGAMATVELTLEQARDAIAGLEATVAIAASNGPRSTVLSGQPEPLAALLERLDERGIFCRMIRVDVASHSPAVDPLRDELRSELAGLRPRRAQIGMISTVSGAALDGSELDAGYWWRNLRAPVLFHAALQSLLADGYRTFVEMSPHPVLKVAIEHQLGEGDCTLCAMRREEPAREVLLEAVAKAYTAGHLPELESLYPGAHCVPLPPYPWQQRSFWVEAPRRTASRGGHPLLGTRLRSAARAIGFEVELTGATPPFLADHIIASHVVVPGASHLAMSLQAVAATDPGCSVERLSFRKALVVEDGTPVFAQLVIEEVDGVRRIQVSSSLGDDAPWTLHAEGQVGPRAVAPPPNTPLAPLRARCAEQQSGADFYSDFYRAGYQLGPSFRWIDALWAGPGEVLARLQRPQLEHPDAYVLHPTLIDACFQAACAALPGGGVAHILTTGDLYVPFSVGRCQVFAVPDARTWCHIVARESASNDDQLFAFDLRLLSEDGAVVAQWDELCLKRVSPAALVADRSAVGQVRRIAWREQPVVPAATERRFCIVGEEREALGAALVERGARVQPGADGCDAVVVLVDPGLQEGSVPAAAACMQVVSILRELEQLRSVPQLYLVTRGACAADERSPIAPAQAPLWGLGAAVASEHPALRCARIDRDPSAVGFADLAGVLLAEGAPSAVAIRGGRALVPRLVAAPPSPRDPPVRGDRSYLVTGGLGALGRLVAQWLVDRGARHLVLAGRSEPSAEVQLELDGLRSAGVEVVTAAVDIAEGPALEALLQRVGADLPPLAGVAHLAGLLDDGILVQQDRERFRAVMAPKIDGTRNLDRLTRGSALDWFVMFSAASALVGLPGQGNYAAANAFMDAVAHARHREGLPAQSINWGPWSDVGLVAADERRVQMVARSGFASIAPADGMGLLGPLMAQGLAQVAVLTVDPQRFRHSTLFEELAPSAGPAPGAQSVRRMLAEAAPATQRSRLAEHIRRAIARVLRMEPRDVPDDAPLGSLGLDSVMALEARSRLEKTLELSLSATLMWAHPNLNALSAYLYERLELGAEEEEAPTDALDDLSEAELAALLAGELSDADQGDMW